MEVFKSEWRYLKVKDADMSQYSKSSHVTRLAECITRVEEFEKR